MTMTPVYTYVRFNGKKARKIESRQEEC